MSLNIAIESTDSCITLFLDGDLDAIGSDRFEGALARAFDTDVPLIVIDLSNMKFIASHGLGILVSAYKKLTATGREIRLVNVTHEIRKIFLITGLDRLLPIHGPEDAADISDEQQGLKNSHEFLLEMFDNLKIDAQLAAAKLDEVFSICTTVEPDDQAANRVKEILGELNLPEKIRDASAGRPKILHERINPYLSGSGSLLHIRCGNGKVAETFAESRRVELVDTVDCNETPLPFKIYDGTALPFADKSFDTSLMINVLSHSKNPAESLQEAIRVTKNRIIVKETVYLNDPQHCFCKFMDWLYTCVIGDGQMQRRSFKTHQEWKQLGQREKLQLKADIDIGLDQVAIPEYHWMYVFDVPSD